MTFVVETTDSGPLDDGEVISAKISFSVGEFFCDELVPIVVETLPLVVDDRLAMRFDYEVPGPVVVQPEGEAPTVDDSPLTVVASARKLAGGVGVMLGLRNETNYPLRVPPDEVLSRWAVGDDVLFAREGRALMTDDHCYGNHPLVEQGRTTWVALQDESADLVLPIAMDVVLSFQLQAPTCGFWPHRVRRSLSVPVGASTEASP